MNVVLANGRERVACVRVKKGPNGETSLNITFLDVGYRYTTERTAGGWPVYQRMP